MHVSGSRRKEALPLDALVANPLGTTIFLLLIFTCLVCLLWEEESQHGLISCEASFKDGNTLYFTVAF